MRPPPALLDALMASRLLPARARPSVGIGERRSRAKGAGMEFVDHRPYRAGDDIRHIDPHVLARSGDAMIREYALNRQLPVTILIDASPSMRIEDAAKLRTACLLGQALGFVALAGGDRVQIAMPAPRGLAPSPIWHGAARAETLFAWVEAQSQAAAPAFEAALGAAPKLLAPGGLLVAISDWWDDDLPARLDALAAMGVELLALQILGAAERDPRSMGTGLIRLEDAETGDDVEVAFDATTLARYETLLAAWQNRLRDRCGDRHWHFLAAPAEADLSDICLRTLRGAGVLS